MSVERPVHPVSIVMIEDDEGHARLIERNLKRAGLVNKVVRVADGQQALDALRARDPDTLPPGAPVLLVLDINMPRLDGVGVLRALKADPATCRIPVIMLTTTDDPQEVDRCYGLGCNVYITKPVEYEGFATAIRQLGLFLAVMKVPDPV